MIRTLTGPKRNFQKFSWFWVLTVPKKNSHGPREIFIFYLKNEFENFLGPREHPKHKKIENFLGPREYPSHKILKIFLGPVNTLTIKILKKFYETY